MKKTFSVLAVAAACAFGFAACDGEGISIGRITGQDVLGHITLVASDVQEGQPYAEGDTIAFKSAMCNVKVEVMDGVTVDAGAVFVGTASDLIANGNADINFPLCGINLRDTVARTYEVSCPVNDFSGLEFAREGNWNGLLLSGAVSLGNVLVVAVDEDNYYLGYDGNIEITQFSAVGGLVKGQVVNMKAFYITKSQMAALWAMDESARAALTPATYFTSVTLNGEISSRRANMEDVLNSLEEL